MSNNNPYWLNEWIWTYVFFRQQVSFARQIFKRKVKRMIWKLQGKPSLEMELREAAEFKRKRDGTKSR